MTPTEDTVSLFSARPSDKQGKQPRIPERVPGSNKMGLDTFPGKSLFECFGQGLTLICCRHVASQVEQPILKPIEAIAEPSRPLIHIQLVRA